MNEDGITINESKLDLALAHALIQSKREPRIFMREVARGVVKKVIGITPPAHITPGAKDENGDQSWNVVTGGAAKVHGVAKVESDIRKLYGTPGDAYAMVKASASHHGMEAGFWAHYKKGELERAAAIFRQVTGRTFGAFDDGKLHQSRRNARGQVRQRGQAVFFVANPDALKAYIKTIKDRVGWLAAGWNYACAMLGVQPPQWIWRHPSPGTGVIIENETGIIIRMTNQVRYVDNINDWQRRIQSAVDSQADALNRRSERFLQGLFKDNNFKLSGFKTAA